MIGGVAKHNCLCERSILSKQIIHGNQQETIKHVPLREWIFQGFFHQLN
jgi:hypothetical protein